MVPHLRLWDVSFSKIQDQTLMTAHLQWSSLEPGQRLYFTKASLKAEAGDILRLHIRHTCCLTIQAPENWAGFGLSFSFQCHLDLFTGENGYSLLLTQLQCTWLTCPSPSEGIHPWLICTCTSGLSPPQAFYEEIRAPGNFTGQQITLPSLQKAKRRRDHWFWITGLPLIFWTPKSHNSCMCFINGAPKLGS